MKSVKIIVATHKKYQMPSDEVYLPLHVGAYGKESIGYKRDDEGDNISSKNPFFCELTGLYYAWKNVKADYIGLVNYRRYLTLERVKEDKFNNILTKSQVQELIKENDIILPNMRNYYIENLYDHYKHTMYVEPLDETRKIISKKYPEYLAEFDKLHERKTAHMFNMFVMRKDILNDYCTWLFDILFELEKKFKNKKYDAFHSRFYGRISELLLDVYINTNNLKYKEIYFMDMEKVNWAKKGTSFLKAKFLGKKYDKSF